MFEHVFYYYTVSVVIESRLPVWWRSGQTLLRRGSRAERGTAGRSATEYAVAAMPSCVTAYTILLSLELAALRSWPPLCLSPWVELMIPNAGTVIVHVCPAVLSPRVVNAHVAARLVVIGCLPIFKIPGWPLIPGIDFAGDWRNENGRPTWYYVSRPWTQPDARSSAWVGLEQWSGHCVYVHSISLYLCKRMFIGLNSWSHGHTSNRFTAAALGSPSTIP
jgi:hypothetical protein